MTQAPTSTPDRFALPLVSLDAGEVSQGGASWLRWSALDPLPQWDGITGVDSPEPLLPQGAYSSAPALVEVPGPGQGDAAHAVELLAPAGGPEAAYAAFHFGADAVYLGLKKFSARAEAENFTLEEVDEVTAYAHGLEPQRRVFVTVNTVIRQDELPELVEALSALNQIGVDALIVQDLGVYHL